MKLNKVSYVHKKIRYLCFFIENESGLPIETDLSKEFDQISFKGELSYITIDYKRYAYYTLNIKLSKNVQQAIEDTLIYLSWLDTLTNYEEERKKRTSKK